MKIPYSLSLVKTLLTVVVLIVEGPKLLNAQSQPALNSSEQSETSKPDEENSKSKDEKQPSFANALGLFQHNFLGRFGRAFEYDFQRVEQPTFLVTGAGALVANPERYLNEHTLKFQFSELFPSTTALGSAFKSACGLASKSSECKYDGSSNSPLNRTEWIAGAGGWWKRSLSGFSVSVDLSERSALQQGVVLFNTSFSNHYQVTGGFDFDPTQLFINGTSWSKAMDAVGSKQPDVCSDKETRYDCIKNWSDVRVSASALPTTHGSTATKLLATLVPTVSFKRVSQFDFVKNGNVLVAANYLEKAQNQFTFKWDLKKAIVASTTRVDAASINSAKSTSTRLCVIVGNATSYINVGQDFPVAACAAFAKDQQAAGYMLACVKAKEITHGSQHDPKVDKPVAIDTDESCWN